MFDLSEYESGDSRIANTQYQNFARTLVPVGYSGERELVSFVTPSMAGSDMADSDAYALAAQFSQSLANCIKSVGLAAKAAKTHLPLGDKKNSAARIYSNSERVRKSFLQILSPHVEGSALQKLKEALLGPLAPVIGAADFVVKAKTGNVLLQQLNGIQKDLQILVADLKAIGYNTMGCTPVNVQPPRTWMDTAFTLGKVALVLGSVYVVGNWAMRYIEMQEK